MRVAAPPLTPIFRSVNQMNLLARVFLDPERSWPVSTWANLAGVTVPTAAREISRAAAAGLLNVERVGTAKLVSANVDSPFYAPLKQILLGSVGVPEIVRSALSDVTEITAAYLFGSWAARLEGIEGSPPQDMDLLVIGDGLDRNAVYDAIDGIATEMPLPVQVTFRSPAEWEDLRDPFVATVRSRPLIEIQAKAPISPPGGPT